MQSKTRVHELAKELGRSSKDIMAKLVEMGEFVKSPSTTIEVDVVRKLRAAFPVDQKPAESPTRPPAPLVVDDELSVPAFLSPPPAGVLRPLRPRREWYRGAELGELTTRILDGVVVPRRPPFSSKPGGSSRYFVDEVADARSLGAGWTDALFEEMKPDEIATWMEADVKCETAIRFRRCGITPDMYSTWLAITYRPTPEQVLVLHKAGIRPDDLKQHPADRGGPSLGLRLVRQQRTLDEVVAEVSRRRADRLGRQAS